MKLADWPNHKGLFIKRAAVVSRRNAATMPLAVAVCMTITVLAKLWSEQRGISPETRFLCQQG
jgi:hypothetical protein